MKIHNYLGFFVAIEGLDGSGSDKITGLLIEELKQQKLPVVATKEPTKGPVGRVIKKLLLKKERPISPILLEFLFAADRALSMEEKIIPSLKLGKIVVSDRCLWSSIAYRSIELPLHWLLEINTRFIIPDVTYFVQVPPSACATKIKRGKDEVQIYSEEEKLNQIEEGYRWIINKFPYWFEYVDGEQKPKKVVEEILTHLQKHQKFGKMKP